VLAFVADVVPAGERVRAFGLLYWAINLGFAIAPVLGGVVAHWSYRALFIGDAATMAIYGVIVLAGVRESRPPTTAEERAAASLASVLRDRTFMIFVGLTILLALVFWQSTVTLAAHFTRQGYGAATFGMVASANGVLIIVSQPWLTARVRNLDPSRVFAISALFAGVGMGLHGLVAVVALHVVAVLLWTVGEILESAFFASTVSALAPVAARGRYQGVFGVSFGIGAALGPPAGAQAVALGGVQAPWVGAFVLGLVAALGFMLTARGRRARGT
jgi:predicted MFS family arabinose efflux permease